VEQFNKWGVKEMATAYGMKLRDDTIELTSDELFILHDELMGSLFVLHDRIQAGIEGKPDILRKKPLNSQSVECFRKRKEEEEQLMDKLQKVCYMSRYDSHDGTMTMDGSMGLTGFRKEKDHNKRRIAYLSVVDKRVSDWIRKE
jgi:hypothetical protein